MPIARRVGVGVGAAKRAGTQARRGNSNYGVLEKTIQLFALADLTLRWDLGCDEMSQIPGLTQPLMLALKRFHGMSQALSGERGVFGMLVCRCYDWRFGVSEFLDLHGYAAVLLLSTIEGWNLKLCLPSRFQTSNIPINNGT